MNGFLFKGSEIDVVLKYLKEEKEGIYASDFQKKYLPEWQLLKVEAIFQYLYNNYQRKFDFYDYSDAFGYILQYSDEWDDDLKKGGFTKFWKERESLKTKIEGILTKAETPSNIISNVLNAIHLFT